MFGRKQLTSVYIVDDNSDAIEVLRRMLESQYSVKVIGTSTDADTAIEEIIQLAPDLIFTDVEMPTMTGIQLCQLLHQEVDPNTKVVFYTGHDKYMIDAIHQKAFDYLLKPPSPQDLAQTMTLSSIIMMWLTLTIYRLWICASHESICRSICQSS